MTGVKIARPDGPPLPLRYTGLGYQERVLGASWQEPARFPFGITIENCYGMVDGG